MIITVEGYPLSASKTNRIKNNKQKRKYKNRQQSQNTHLLVSFKLYWNGEVLGTECRFSVDTEDGSVCDERACSRVSLLKLELVHLTFFMIRAHSKVI